MRQDATTFGAGLCAAALVALSGTPPAAAQNALGDGRALDSNLRAGSGGYNEVPASFRSELEIRNAIVTGNAPGGFSFRGEVGYTAANDFRGALGSNEIFQYQRDSFYSGLATRNLAGLAALQTPLVYSIAGQSAGYFGGPLIIDRSGSHASVETATAPVGQGLVRSDMYGMIAGSMRTPSLQVLRMAEQAETIAVSSGMAEGERLIVSASPLLGIKTLPSTSIVVDAATRYAEPAPSLALPAPTEREPGGEGEDASTARGLSLPISPHQRILNALAGEQSRVVQAREDTRVRPTTALELQTQAEAQPEPGLEPTPPTTGPEPTPAPTPGLEAPSEGTEGTKGTGEMAPIPGLQELRDLLSDHAGAAGSKTDSSTPGHPEGTARPTVADVARRVFGGVSIPQVDHLTSSATSQSVYIEHMRRGEEMLAEDRWFQAEERFTAAIAVLPGNALAAAGRVHAQIGAGMYLSAAVNLRNLLRAYPEFIPVRFDEKLLPRGDRLGTIEAQLRQRTERDTPIARDAALLMAYLGHQYDDRALLDEGFATLDRVEAALDMERDALEEALRAVWLEGKE